MYEHKLKNSFYSYTLEQGISENKIRKTELIYYSKSNRYEYRVYIKEINDDMYYNFIYLLPYNQLKSYLTQKIGSDFKSSVYIEGSIEDIDSHSAIQLINKSN